MRHLLHGAKHPLPIILSSVKKKETESNTMQNSTGNNRWSLLEILLWQALGLTYSVPTCCQEAGENLLTALLSSRKHETEKMNSVAERSILSFFVTNSVPIFTKAAWFFCNNMQHHLQSNIYLYTQLIILGCICIYYITRWFISAPISVECTESLHFHFPFNRKTFCTFSAVSSMKRSPLQYHFTWSTSLK